MLPPGPPPRCPALPCGGEWAEQSLSYAHTTTRVIYFGLRWLCITIYYYLRTPYYCRRRVLLSAVPGVRRAFSAAWSSLAGPVTGAGARNGWRPSDASCHHPVIVSPDGGHKRPPEAVSGCTRRQTYGAPSPPPSPHCYVWYDTAMFSSGPARRA